MRNIAFLTSWNLLKVDGRFYIGGTHFTYLQYASANFNRIFLVSSVRESQTSKNQMELGCFDNIEIVELPAVNSYLGALCNYRSYCRAIEYVKSRVDFFYCRVPDPFCWLPRLKYNIPSVMHYVGDAIDATLHNEKWSWTHKMIMICGYLPEYMLTLRASRLSTVYTNGIHLHEKLNKRNIVSTPVISSTVSELDIIPLEPFRYRIPPRMIYVGYLRFAKGMNLLKNLWVKLKQDWPDFRFDVVGNGEMETNIKEFIARNKLSDNIIMHGRIDNRNELRQIIRQADLFVFPSLSEGSPRVVIEAMAEGLPVISTPVGSLPGTFEDKESIRYFDFNDTEQAFNIIMEYGNSPQLFEKQRSVAFEMIKNYFTKEKFLSKVFTYEA